MAKSRTGSPLDDYDILEVSPPRFDGSEKVIAFWEDNPARPSANNLMRRLNGSEIPRSTLYRWANKPGYPIGRDRFIRFPAANKAVRDPKSGRTVAKRVTTREAVERFIARCRQEGAPVSGTEGVELDQ